MIPHFVKQMLESWSDWILEVGQSDSVYTKAS
jgi:hypothetical protein